MKLGLSLPAMAPRAEIDMETIRLAENLGYDSVWASEAWGSDAATVLAWIASDTTRIRVGSAILQIPGRTPTMTAMTATTINELSGGRFILGLGASGPQVAEGWHGEPYGKPLGRTREYVSIVRQVAERKKPLQHKGDHYSIPITGPGTTGLGKPLKLITHPTHSLPIYLAAMGPRNVKLAAEIADGWLPTIFSPFRFEEVFKPSLDSGFRTSGDPEKVDRFKIAPTAMAVITDDAIRARDRARPNLALYIGGMGAVNRNFYNDLVARYGYEEKAAEIQRLYLGGERLAAIRQVPDALIDEVSLIGTADQVQERLQIWKEAGVNTLIVAVSDDRTLRILPDLLP